MTPDSGPVQQPQGGVDQQSSVRETIQSFETILELFPDDIGAIESLAAAYEQVGAALKAREMSVRLAKLMADGAQWARVEQIAARLLEINPEDIEAQDFLEQAITNSMPPARPPAAPSAPSSSADEQLDTASAGMPVDRDPSLLRFEMQGEIELALMLQQSDVITQQQYEVAVMALQERRQQAAPGTSLSMLSELQAMTDVDMEKVLDAICRQTRTPFIEVSRCEPDDELLRLIPLAVCEELGVLPFGRMRDELMVAVLNPLPGAVSLALSTYLAAPVHLYVTSPEELRNALAKLAKRLSEE